MYRHAYIMSRSGTYNKHVCIMPKSGTVVDPCSKVVFEGREGVLALLGVLRGRAKCAKLS